MQVSKELPFEALTNLATDKHGVESFVLVVKGTFTIPRDGSEPLVAEEQAPLVYADSYFGDPAGSSIRHPYDFALRKPMTDVILIGSAHAPAGTRARQVTVALRVGEAIAKAVTVVGDRHWERGTRSPFIVSEATPFETMPLVYERAFGGADTAHPDPARHAFHRENLVGTGVIADTDPALVAGRPLPNLEHPRHPIRDWGDTTPTVGFGALCPHWLPRASRAGTYDDAWLKDRYPLLPLDFDERFHQAAPADQTVPYLTGGEPVTLANMDPTGRLSFRLPRVPLPVIFLYSDRKDEHYEPVLDTVIIEPDAGRLQLVWRLTVRRIGKPYALVEVVVGDMSARWWRRHDSFKPFYASLGELVRNRGAY